jgi:metal-responsive CopG/Arc/MetJ family transcriptional regulator
MAATKTDTSSEAQGRFVVSLPKEVGARIDELIRQTADKLREEIGVGVEISRAQMVQTLVQDALKQRNGDE